MKKLLLGLCLAGSLTGGWAEVILDRPMSGDNDLKGVYGRVEALTKIVDLPEGGKALEFTVPDDLNVKPDNKFAFHIDGAKIAGQRVRFSGEAKVINAVETAKWGGGSFTMWYPYKDSKESGFEHVYIGTKTDGWKMLQKDIDVPLNVSHLLLSIGLSNARGTVLFRNIKIETLPKDAAGAK